MISKHDAGQEIGRLIGLDYFPSDPKAINELVVALTYAETNIIAVAVINEWLEDQSRRPTPAALRRMVADHNEARKATMREEGDREQQAMRPDCSRCGDHGFVGGYVGTSHDGPWGWCECSVAHRKYTDDPELVDRANVARTKLIAAFGEGNLGGMVGKLSKRKPHLGDEYFGAF